MKFQLNHLKKQMKYLQLDYLLNILNRMDSKKWFHL